MAFPTTNLGLTEIETSQSQKEVTANENFQKIDDAFGDLPTVPAGTNGQVQYNNAGVLAGMAGKTINIDLGAITAHYTRGVLTSVTLNSDSSEISAANVVASTGVTS